MDDEPLVAMVTGGAGALGRAVAVELARRGWSIFLQHGPGAAVDEAVAAIRSAGQAVGKDVAVENAPADLTVSEDREAIVESVLEAFGRIDMLVNCPAGSGQPAGDLLEIVEDDFRAVMEGEVTATLFLTQLVAREMVRLAEAGQVENPRIVTVNSIAAYATIPDRGPHCMAAAAMAMLTRLFADRLGEHGIDVFEVRAGIVAAGPTDAVHARYGQLVEQGLTPIRRIGRPGDVARAVAAVADDLLGFSTGEVINVDGGFHLRRL